MLPVCPRKLVERHHPLPVALERAPDVDVATLRAPRLERPLLPLRLLSGLGVRALGEQTARFGLPSERQLVEDVQQAMAPAPLLLRFGDHRRQCPPDPEMPGAAH